MKTILRKWKNEDQLYHWIMYEYLDFFWSEELKKKYNSWKDKDYIQMWWAVYVKNWWLWNPNFSENEFNDALVKFKQDKEYLLSLEDKNAVDEKKLVFKWISNLWWDWMRFEDYREFVEWLKIKIKKTRFPLAYLNKEQPIVNMNIWPKINFDK